MKDFNWNEFKDGKIIVNCKTEEDSKDFFVACKNKKIKWCSKSYLNENHTRWDTYDYETCYMHMSGLSFCSKDYFLNRYKNCKIIVWNENNTQEVETKEYPVSLTMDEFLLLNELANKQIDSEILKCENKRKQLQSISDRFVTND